MSIGHKKDIIFLGRTGGGIDHGSHQVLDVYERKFPPFQSDLDAPSSMYCLKIGEKVFFPQTVDDRRTDDDDGEGGGKLFGDFFPGAFGLSVIRQWIADRGFIDRGAGKARSHRRETAQVNDILDAISVSGALFIEQGADGGVGLEIFILRFGFGESGAVEYIFRLPEERRDDARLGEIYSEKMDPGSVQPSQIGRLPDQAMNLASAVEQGIDQVAANESTGPCSMNNAPLR